MNDHSHCEICGRMVAVGDRLCDSKDCAEKKAEAQAMKKRTMYLFIALIVAVLLFSKFLQI